jgi:hypothetical protein
VGWIKYNVDVAFVVDSGVTSVGLCFHDTNGQFVASFDSVAATCLLRSRRRGIGSTTCYGRG